MKAGTVTGLFGFAACSFVSASPWKSVCQTGSISAEYLVWTSLLARYDRNFQVWSAFGLVAIMANALEPSTLDPFTPASAPFWKTGMGAKAACPTICDLLASLESLYWNSQFTAKALLP